MKQLAIASLALACGILAPDLVAQDAEKLESLYQEKLGERFLKKAAWVTDYDEARRLAAEQDKVIFAYFTRSYAH